MFRKAEILGAKAVVYFDYAKEGLMVGRIEGIGKIVEETDGILNGFELVGQDGVWHPAQARTKGAVVMVESSLVKQPVAVAMPVIRRPQEGSSVEPLQQGGLTCLAVLLGLEADAI